MPRRQGEFSAIETGKKEPGMTEFLKRKAAKGIAKSTLRSYANHIGLLRRMAPRPLLELSEDEATDVAIKLTKLRSGHSLAITVRMFLRFHKKDELADMFKIRRPKKRLDPKGILLLEDINAMIRACDSLRDRAFVSILWESGGRIHEVLALDMDDTRKVSNGEDHFYKVFFKKVKVQGEEHSAPLIESASHLEAWLEAYPLQRTLGSPLFISLENAHYGKRLTHYGARYILRRIAERAGIEKPANPHAFRHSRTTHLLRAGTHEPVVKRLLGWNPNTTMLGRYSHLVDQDVDNALLQAHGKEPIKPIEIGGLIEATGDMEPVLPIATRTEPLVLDEKAIVEKLFEKVKAWTKEELEAGHLHLAKEG